MVQALERTTDDLLHLLQVFALLVWESSKRLNVLLEILWQLSGLKAPGTLSIILHSWGHIKFLKSWLQWPVWRKLLQRLDGHGMCRMNRLRFIVITVLVLVNKSLSVLWKLAFLKKFFDSIQLPDLEALDSLSLWLLDSIYDRLALSQIWKHQKLGTVDPWFKSCKEKHASQEQLLHKEIPSDVQRVFWRIYYTCILKFDSYMHRTCYIYSLYSILVLYSIYIHTYIYICIFQ